MDCTKIKIAVITTVRNDNLFLIKWIDYYGSIFGHKNLFVFLDGHDQKLPECDNVNEVNFLKLPHKNLKRSKGDRNRALQMSYLAHSLFLLFDTILAMDVDEFLVLDPLAGTDLINYLSTKKRYETLSALGLDVGQNLEIEKQIDFNKPFLNQRNFAHISSRYTKPVVANKPVIWGSGMHRIKGSNYRIDKNLYLFHFGMVDYEKSKHKLKDEDLIQKKWINHIKRRKKLFEIITKNKPIAWDKVINKARFKQQYFRKILAWNKPSSLFKNKIVIIDKRFKDIV
jgi:hypothetical protein